MILRFRLLPTVVVVGRCACAAVLSPLPSRLLVLPSCRCCLLRASAFSSFMVGFLPEQGISTPPGFAAIMPVDAGMDWLSEAAAAGCGARGIPPELLEVAVTGCGARGMLPRNNIEGESIAGPTVGVVPGVGAVAVVGDGPAGLGVPMKNDSGNESDVP